MSARLGIVAAALLAPASFFLGASTPEIAKGPGFDTIREKDLEAHIEFLASPGMEGRDTPSEGQARAAAYLAERFASWGLGFAPDSLEVMGDFGDDGPEHDATQGSFLRPFHYEANAPDPDGCSLKLLGAKEPAEFLYGRDFVPVHRASGSASGDLVFGGFGIVDPGEHYDDYKGMRLNGKVVLFFEGEPRHKKKFGGEEVTPAASLWDKLNTLNREDAAGALVVRRAPEGAEEDEENGLDYRYSYASFLDAKGGTGPRQPSKSLPTLEISMECASRLLGEDARELAQRMDKKAKPVEVDTKGLAVDLASFTSRREIRHDNVVGVLPGSDPVLAKEYVLLGAHYDHIGVGPGGRVGCGADDNASGVAALLEVAEAMAEAPPRRSVIFACFAGEEDGLLGARYLSERLPVPQEQIVCMINLDMIGRGNAKETSVLGVDRNPALAKVLDRARKLEKTGLRKVIEARNQDIWERSDHFVFHEIGLPVLFFFEGLPITDNKDYHTWRDTIDKVDLDKVTHTARVVFNTVWILANDDDRPPAPRD